MRHRDVKVGDKLYYASSTNAFIVASTGRLTRVVSTDARIEQGIDRYGRIRSMRAVEVEFLEGAHRGHTETVPAARLWERGPVEEFRAKEAERDAARRDADGRAAELEKKLGVKIWLYASGRDPRVSIPLDKLETLARAAGVTLGTEQ